MANTTKKEYLDFEGLKLYDEQIKKLIANSNDVERAYVDSLIGNFNEIKNDLGNDISTIAKALIAEKLRAEAIE